MPAAHFISQYLPHAPDYGLYVRPDLPADKVSNALRAYARDVQSEHVVALYDATLMNTGRDGGVFLPERFIFRNNRLSGAQVINYDDVIGVRSRRKLLGGRQLLIDVNRGSASVTVRMDFSGKPAAAAFVERLLKEIMIGGMPEKPAEGGPTDPDAVRNALARLVEKGTLSKEDFERMLSTIRKR